MTTHNICFYGNIRKIIPELSSNTLLQRVLWIHFTSCRQESLPPDRNLCFCADLNVLFIWAQLFKANDVVS